VFSLLPRCPHAFAEQQVAFPMTGHRAIGGFGGSFGDVQRVRTTATAIGKPHSLGPAQHPAGAQILRQFLGQSTTGRPRLEPKDRFVLAALTNAAAARCVAGAFVTPETLRPVEPVQARLLPSGHCRTAAPHPVLRACTETFASPASTSAPPAASRLPCDFDSGLPTSTRISPDGTLRSSRADHRDGAPRDALLTRGRLRARIGRAARTRGWHGE
jgi:hypothetical protein